MDYGLDDRGGLRVRREHVPEGGFNLGDLVELSGNSEKLDGWYLVRAFDARVCEWVLQPVEIVPEDDDAAFS